MQVLQWTRIFKLHLNTSLHGTVSDDEKTCRSGPPRALCPVVVHGSFSSHGKELVADLLDSLQVCSGDELNYLNARS